MAYTSMKKLITNQNIKYKNGSVTKQEYDLWKESTMTKLDVFLACNRVTVEQYEELVNMFLI